MEYPQARHNGAERLEYLSIRGAHLYPKALRQGALSTGARPFFPAPHPYVYCMLSDALHWRWTDLLNRHVRGLPRADLQDRAGGVQVSLPPLVPRPPVLTTIVPRSPARRASRKLLERVIEVR